MPVTRIGADIWVLHVARFVSARTNVVAELVMWDLFKAKCERSGGDDWRRRTNSRRTSVLVVVVHSY